MNLREISAALQRGETLTKETSARAICALRGKDFGGLYNHYLGFVWREPGDAQGIVTYWNAGDAGNPFTNSDAAFSLTREIFPKSAVFVGVNSEKAQAQIYPDAMEPSPCFVAWAYTPSAAIMAAAIQAHLAKGGV